MYDNRLLTLAPSPSPNSFTRPTSSCHLQGIGDTFPSLLADILAVLGTAVDPTTIYLLVSSSLTITWASGVAYVRTYARTCAYVQLGLGKKWGMEAYVPSYSWSLPVWRLQLAPLYLPGDRPPSVFVWDHHLSFSLSVPSLGSDVILCWFLQMRKSRATRVKSRGVPSGHFCLPARLRLKPCFCVAVYSSTVVTMTAMLDGMPSGARGGVAHSVYASRTSFQPSSTCMPYKTIACCTVAINIA